MSDLDVTPQVPADDRPVVDPSDDAQVAADDVEVDLEADPADTVEQTLVVAIDDDEYR